MSNGPGRPRLASRELLQEAAFELFQLRGYRQTTVEAIAKTAGFSRATFFNFFSSKAEIFWVETDARIAELAEHLDREIAQDPPAELEEALMAFASGLGGEAIPWALQNSQLIEATDDLIASGAGRVLRISRMFGQYLEDHAARRGAAVRGEGTEAASTRRARAAALTGAFLTALLEWVNAGVGRGALGDHLESIRCQGRPVD